MNWAELLRDLQLILMVFDKLNQSGVIKVKEQPAIDAIGQVVGTVIAQHIASQP